MILYNQLFYFGKIFVDFNGNLCYDKSISRPRRRGALPHVSPRSPTVLARPTGSALPSKAYF